MIKILLVGGGEITGYLKFKIQVDWNLLIFSKSMKNDVRMSDGNDRKLIK